MTAGGCWPQPSSPVSAELLALVEQHALAGTGIGYVDTQLLAATRLCPHARLWTTDQRLAGTATRLGITTPNT